ncbi:hypothetical protein ACUN0C_00740 [Faunimonas sp. B44]|uniref:hypothetical protein n=1 Tax=Faunimonas sp. B44 TaxID=3461493 RepID=UPI004043A618
MPILIILLLAILIAQIGFWNTLTAILGGIAMVILLIGVAIALVLAVGYLLKRRLFGERPFRD